MNLPPDHYFVLIVPIGIFLLGMALFTCWRVLRQQHFLPWLATGYLLPALAMAVQSLMSNEQLADWSVIAAALYLVGGWALTRGLAMRHGGDVSLPLAIVIGVTTLALLYYYSRVEEQLWTRAICLNTALALMYLLPFRSILRRRNPGDTLERIVRWSYIACVGYALLRPLLIMALAPDYEMAMLTRSGYWLLTLAASLIFSIWFMFILLACALRDVMRVLHEERNRDPLTQLINRRAFFESAERALQDSNLAPWALLACDVDHFKQVNDTWGHTAGDQVLQSVAHILTEQVRRDDLVSRFGGEEFIILLNRSDAGHARSVAQRIQSQLALTRFSAIPGKVTVSFGLTLVTSAADLAHAIERADISLYQAKQSGRDRICMLPEEPPA
ncbi:GGDEF domain-containing protein [Stutzerimonas kirkiae]|uniref:diguanylate cyclase n=1 Tax=Stutzerimonas kirkiae TaxID=2211392 RepID=A0A4Q9R1N1_9GAMM|nr:GGDEF domain-containing protein [Stutzerimonas kirkiae]TBU92844.1 GGDEF domain-containing protein [Stutzerimonas kirkiae]TBV01307.1 GGDEF domain-containing protein [Stutzerimonas kirkiae]